jgi:phospholipase C
VVDSGRRQFLQLGAGAATLGALPSSIARALALPAGGRSGTIEDVEHVVIFMQENRSFDHYFGHLRGVRGYNDRFPVLRADGRPIWTQPRQDVATEAVLPFHLTTQLTSAQCVLDLDHSWYRTHAALAGGRNDQWPLHKTDMTMGYYTREDLPFHYALADAFTVCDHYFCSTPNQTHPNRMYLMTGTTDPTGAGGGPLMDNNDQVDKPFAKKVLPAFTYTTYPERLQAAGISWQVYQQGTSVEDSYNGNFGTNVLGNFKSFIEAPEGSPLHARGMSKRTLEDLAADVKADRLPQVSWLLPPAAYSEHPKWTPGYGAAYMSRVLDALTANPDVWAKTALFVMYDENDGYFDHVPPPQPPTPALPGKSTISVAGEVHDVVNPLNADRYHADNLPYGLGPRVPMMVISPWSKGGFVCSQVFDHTSVLMFLERRFGVMEPNITAWRRFQTPAAISRRWTRAVISRRPPFRPRAWARTWASRRPASVPPARCPIPWPWRSWSVRLGGSRSCSATTVRPAPASTFTVSTVKSFRAATPSRRANVFKITGRHPRSRSASSQSPGRTDLPGATNIRPPRP